jgi:hypothetical protein
MYLFGVVGISAIASGLLLQSFRFLRPVLTLLIAIVLSSMATGISIIQPSDINLQRPLSLFLATGLVVAMALVYRQILSPKFIFSLVVQAVATVGILAGIEMLVRNLRLASIAFGDIFTIVSFADIILKEGQGLDGYSLSLVLKRGVGFSSLQSLAPADQVSHAIPAFAFLAWVVASIYILRRVLNSKSSFLVAAIVFIGVSLTTEAVLRNFLFLSSHILVASALLLMLHFYLEKSLSTRDTIVLSFALASAIMLRADNALIMLLPVLLIWTGNQFQDKARASLLLSLSYLALPFWLVTFRVDMPLLVIIASVIFAIALGLALYRAPSKLLAQVHRYVASRAIWLPLLGVIVSLATSASLLSIEALYLNYILGEGLWGFTVAALVVAAVIYVIRMRVGDKSIDRIAPMAFGILGMIIWAKFGDVFISQESLATLAYSSSPLEFARIGWGDSLNRLFIYAYLPLMLFVIANGSKAVDKKYAPQRNKS